MNYIFRLTGLILLFGFGLKAQDSNFPVQTTAPVAAAILEQTTQGGEQARLVELTEKERYQLFISQLNNLIAPNQRTYTKGQTIARHAGVISSALPLSLIISCGAALFSMFFPLIFLGAVAADKKDTQFLSRCFGPNGVTLINVALLCIFVVLPTLLLAPVNTVSYHFLSDLFTLVFFKKQKNLSTQILQYFLQPATEDACPPELKPMIKSIRQQIFDNEGKKTGLSTQENMVLVKFLISYAGLLSKLPVKNRPSFNMDDLIAKPAQWKNVLYALKTNSSKQTQLNQTILASIKWSKTIAGMISFGVALVTAVVFAITIFLWNLLTRSFGDNHHLKDGLLIICLLFTIGIASVGFCVGFIAPLFIPIILHSLKIKVAPQQKVDKQTLENIVKNYKAGDYALPPFMEQLIVGIRDNGILVSLNDTKVSEFMSVIREWAKIQTHKKPAKGTTL